MAGMDPIRLSFFSTNEKPRIADFYSFFILELKSWFSQYNRPITIINIKKADQLVSLMIKKLNVFIKREIKRLLAIIPSRHTSNHSTEP